MSTERKRPVISDGLPSQLPDIDPEETTEWVESLDGVIDERGAEARPLRDAAPAGARPGAPGRRTAADHHGLHQHDPARARAVVPRRRARRAAHPRLHPVERGDAGAPRAAARASASAGTSRPTPAPPACTRSGFNHFFRGKDHPGGGDQIFFQGHASPGMYARAFIEGRLSEDQLDGFRQELSHAAAAACLATRTRG